MKTPTTNKIPIKRGKYFGVRKESYTYKNKKYKYFLSFLSEKYSPTNTFIRIGTFKTEIEAAKAYDQYVYNLGVINSLNFPEDFGLPPMLVSYVDYENNCGYILLNTGDFAIVDIEDYEKYNKYKWHISYKQPKAHINNKVVSLPRTIANTNSNETIMFKNENTLDCRKSNIYNENKHIAQSKISKNFSSRESTKNKRSKSHKEKWNRPGYKEKFSKTMSIINSKPEIIEKHKKTGKEMHANNPNAVIKAHETKKKNGSYGKSKFEDKVYEILCEYFGKENIERQKIINKYPIDFYIKSIDTWLQTDGKYHHGLSLPIELLKNSDKKQYQNIYKTYLRDIEQNKYFEKENLQFIRLTDKDFYKMIKEDKFHGWICKELCCIACA